MEEYKRTADPSDLLRPKKPASESAFQSSGETKPVHIHPTDPNAAPTHISTTLDNKYKEALIQFLHQNWDIFAWKPSNMPGVPRVLAEHHLRVDPKIKPIKEHLRWSAVQKRKAIGQDGSAPSSRVHPRDLPLRVARQRHHGPQAR